MTPRRCVFIDFDGTLAERGVVPREHAEAVQRARANGHLVLLCTGRPASIVAPEVAALFDGVVASAGGYLRLGQEVLHDERFPAELGRRTVEVLGRYDPAFVLESPEALWCTPASARRIRARMGGDSPAGPAGIGSGPADILAAVRVRDELADRSFAKISLWGSPVPIEQLADEIGPEVGALPNSITTEDLSAGELHLSTVDKADGMRRVIERLDMGAGETVAIGDGMNDLGMLRAAGTAIAVEGSPAEILAAADLVVPGPAGLGIVRALQRLGML
ncbi:HAD family hydrolase [Brachybacterium sacelli]|uniref:Hydroxymethylpyrimidine pyrophosphatase-like HAD family hydrolase n=1 Tax=Brachybacterium sacelli TaxID=173364 RepID=A0ABS4X0P3_9MICO|nr:HAD family hydrolase [Brachybacterium sacelli]MBP2382022.1 hydroxymethylpyrimidine pyrophosphatase-like HAD family hydrolase [Brachybacterium sacelli]